MFKIILIVAICTIAGLFVLTKFDPNNQQTENSSYLTSETNKNLATINISGEINHPGDYQIDITQTLGDLITLAGGVTDKADPNSYVSTLVIGDRDMFYIPSSVQIPESCVVEQIEKVNINTATLAQLQEIGFKSNQAEALIEYRKEKGSFQCIEDILNVSGIGEATYTKLRELITLS